VRRLLRIFFLTRKRTSIFATHNGFGPLFIAAEADEEQFFQSIDRKKVLMSMLWIKMAILLGTQLADRGRAEIVAVGAEIDSLGTYGETPLYLALGRSPELAVPLIGNGASL
jgi:hypothetical protein